uniref:Uncharacterized protein n=1 Tax=Anguilla anguilla TaxID=7936 RepID=A0A0E9S3J3_ANGAN
MLSGMYENAVQSQLTSILDQDHKRERSKAAFPPQELYPGTRKLLRNSVRFHRRN